VFVLDDGPGPERRDLAALAALLGVCGISASVGSFLDAHACVETGRVVHEKTNTEIDMVLNQSEDQSLEDIRHIHFLNASYDQRYTERHDGVAPLVVLPRAVPSRGSSRPGTSERVSRPGTRGREAHPGGCREFAADFGLVKDRPYDVRVFAYSTVVGARCLAVLCTKEAEGRLREHNGALDGPCFCV